MFLMHRRTDGRDRLDPADADLLGGQAVAEVGRFLRMRSGHGPTPLHELPALAAALGVGAIQIKDEGLRLGLGSFKALGGAYAVVRLVLEAASGKLGRTLDVTALRSPQVAAVARSMTVACATDGNHGRSVADGARFVGAKAKIFVHSGVSEVRVDAIRRFGAETIRVDGSYDDSVREAARIATERGWMIVSDTAWPGYEHVPGLVMQGYTAILGEALAEWRQPPTHIFIQAGVGGIAATIAGHLATVMGDDRPRIIVVEPARAACLFASAAAGHLVKLVPGKPTVMAMLECHEPSSVAWRILSRAADAFMTVDEDDAIDVMNRLARPRGDDPAIVAGESGGVGLAGLIRAMADPAIKASLGLNGQSRVFLVNTEGATDPQKYRELVGLAATDVDAGRTTAAADTPPTRRALRETVS